MHKQQISFQNILFRRFRTVYIFGLLAFILMLTLAACGGNDSSAPDVHKLIKDSQTAIQQVKSYHFNLAVQHPGTGGTLPIQSADGDILVPDKLHANAKALVAGSVVPVEIIAIGTQQYINLLGLWQPTSNLLDPRTLSDPPNRVPPIFPPLPNPPPPTPSPLHPT